MLKINIMKKLLRSLGLLSEEVVETKVLSTGLVCKIYKSGKVVIN